MTLQVNLGNRPGSNCVLLQRFLLKLSSNHIAMNIRMNVIIIKNFQILGRLVRTGRTVLIYSLQETNLHIVEKQKVFYNQQYFKQKVIKL